MNWGELLRLCEVALTHQLPDEKSREEPSALGDLLSQNHGNIDDLISAAGDIVRDPKQLKFLLLKFLEED